MRIHWLTVLQEALEHVWLSGDTATEHNLLPEIRSYIAKSRLKRGIELVKLANRIEALKLQEDDEEDVPGEADVPANSAEAVGNALANPPPGTGLHPGEGVVSGEKKKNLSRIAKGAIFREVVLAKVREAKEQEERDKVAERARQDSIARHSE